MRPRPLLIANASPIVTVMSETEGPKRGRKKPSPAAPEVPEAEAAQPEAAPSEGARNPWHPINAEAPQRRSASIEDILRSRSGGRVSLPGSLGAGWFGWAALGVVAAWLITTSIHVLDTGERGVLTTFGRYQATLGPGFNVTMPWPVQAVKRVEVGKELITLLPEKEAETLMLTRDGQLIDVRLQVRWRIGDPRRYTYTFADGPAALQRLADSTIRSAVAEFTFDELRGSKRRAELHQRVQTRLQRVLNAWGAGVSVAGVDVTGTNMPAKLAEPAKQIDKEKEEARKNYGAAVIYANETKKAAEAEAAAFDKAYALYKIAPEVTRSQIYYRTLEIVLRNNQVVMGGTGAAISLPPPPGTKPPTAAPQEGRQP